MSLTSSKSADLDTSAAVSAAQRARAAGSVAAANAARSVTLAARSGSGRAQTGMRQGLNTARNWAAPRIDGAADYCTTTVAPKVSSALRATARQVSPPETTKPKRSPALTWSLLGAAVVAALGAAAAVVRYRYRAAIAADSETADEEALGDDVSGQAAPATPEGADPAAAPPKEAKDQSSDTPVNGRVTSSGW